MNSFATRILATLLVAGLFYQTARANPVESMDISSKCIEEVGAEFDKIVVPEWPQKLAGFVRSLNPQKENLSLSMLLEDRTSERNVLDKGFIQKDQLDDVANSCSDFIEHIMEKMNSSECGRQMLEVSEENDDLFLQILQREPKIERVVGFARVCQ